MSVMACADVSSEPNIARPRTILHLRGTWIRNGSVEQLVRAIIRQMDSSKWNHHVGKIGPIAVRYGGQLVEDNVLTAEEVGPGRWHRIPWEWSRVLASGVAEVHRIVQRQQIDLIHCHDNRANLLGLLVGRRTGIPVVASLYGWIKTSMKLRALAAIDAYLLRFAAAVIATSASMMPLIPRVSRANTIVIPNGVEDVLPSNSQEEIDGMRRELGLKEDDVIITTVGRLSPEKGQQVLVSAAKYVCDRLPCAKFLVVGEGPMQAMLMQQIASLNLTSHVILAGPLDHRQLSLVRSISDLIVQPSLSESLPLALLEGMAYGKAVVASRVGSIDEAVIPGETGVLVSPGSVEQLADSIAAMLCDPAERTRLGERGAALVRARFSTTEMVRRVEDVYFKALARKPDVS